MRARSALLAILVLVVFSLTVRAQEGQAVARYDERGHMVKISNLSVRETRERCARFVYVGKVTHAEYDNRGRLIEFQIRRRGRPVRFNLVDAAFDAADVGRLPTLIKKGSRVRVVAYGCGASAAVLDADSITSAGR